MDAERVLIVKLFSSAVIRTSLETKYEFKNVTVHREIKTKTPIIMASFTPIENNFLTLTFSPISFKFTILINLNLE